MTCVNCTHRYAVCCGCVLYDKPHRRVQKGDTWRRRCPALCLLPLGRVQYRSVHCALPLFSLSVVPDSSVLFEAFTSFHIFSSVHLKLFSTATMSQEKKAAAMQTPPYTDSPGVQMQMPHGTPGIPAQAPYAMQAQSPYPTPGGYAPMQSHSAYPTPDGYAPMQAPYGTPNMGTKGPVAMQPMGRPSMVLDAGMPRDANGEREWKHKMCGCTDACGFCESRVS
jgi:hypothetical protein